MNVNLDAHIWLLHHIFLPAINQDAEEWTATWNNHTLARRGEPHRTPTNMYIYGMVENGTRGIHVASDIAPNNPEEPIGDTDDDYAGYGIDWDSLDNRGIREHHDRFNPEDGDPTNPFTTNQPDKMSHVGVPEARCPFESHQVHWCDAQLNLLPHRQRNDMHSRRLIWVDALRIASSLFQA